MNDSTKPKANTLQAKLRQVRGAHNQRRTRHEDNIVTVIRALESGDEVLVAALAKMVGDQRSRLRTADHLGVRDAWLETLATWDGQYPPAAEQAEHFSCAMARYLDRYAEHEPDDIATPECIEAVRLAFEKRMATGFYGKNPGRSLMSAGFVAMGIPRREADDLLAKIDKASKASRRLPEPPHRFR